MDINPYHRHSIRLKNWDYTNCGYYFVTICTDNRRIFFGKIENGVMVLNKLGEIVQQQWLWLAKQYPYVELDEYVVMPNHLHGIIIINFDNILKPVGAGLAPALTTRAAVKAAPANGHSMPTLGNIIGAYKSICFKQWRDYVYQNHINGATLKFWQRNYYEHIIRNEKSLIAIREYTHNNPAQWEWDRNNPKNIK